MKIKLNFCGNILYDITNTINFTDITLQIPKSFWLEFIIPPASTKLIGGYTGITLSVCPSVDRIVSALYLQQYSSDPFHICTSYQATSEGVSRVMPVSKFFKSLKFWRIFKICNFDFVIFWLGIQYDSMVLVIMRRRGVSSERRRSSCSSLITQWRYNLQSRHYLIVPQLWYFQFELALCYHDNACQTAKLQEYYHHQC